MPILTGMSRALVDFTKSSVERSADRGRARGSIDFSEMIGATEYADMAAAEAHQESLALELRAPDGSIVPTESIGVQDTEFLLSLARQDDYVPPDPLFADTEEEKQLMAAIEHDEALLEEWFGPDWDCEDDKPWEETSSFPRYQIHVSLLDGSAIP